MGKEVSIIADGGHAAAYDINNDVSIDEKGVHRGDGALPFRRIKTWVTAPGFIKAVAKGWSTPTQMDALELVYSKYKN